MRHLRRICCLRVLASLVFTAAGAHAQTATFAASSTDFGSLNVCPAGTSTPAPCSKTLAINFTVTASGTLGAPKVLTLGTPNLDYTLASSSCLSGVMTGQTCTVQVTFKPRLPGARAGALELTDTTGNILATEYLGGEGIGPQVAFVQTRSKPVVVASLPQPQTVAVDGAHNVYAAQFDVPYITEIPFGCNDASCQITIGAGLINPYAIALDGAGNVYALSNFRTQVVKIPVGCKQTSCESFVGGTRVGDGGIALDRDGNVYITDNSGHEILKAAPGCSINHCLSAFSTATAYPWGIALDGANNVYVADGNGIDKIPAGGGPPTTIYNGSPGDLRVSVDAAGDVYFLSWPDIHGFSLLNELTPTGLLLDVGPDVASLITDSDGNLYFTDYTLGNISEIVRQTPASYSFANSIVGTQSGDSPLMLAVQNSGNANLSLSITPPDATSFIRTAGTGQLQECPGNISLNPGAVCDVSISFVPATVGVQSGSSIFTDNSLNLYEGTGVNLPTSTPANFPSGFTGATAATISLNNGASISGSALQLTDGGLNETRSAFLPSRVDITSFETSFDFQLSGKSSATPDADGFMFVLQPLGPNAVGSAGDGLGFGLTNAAEAVEFTQDGTIPISVGIKFDLRNNAGEGTSSTGVYLDGATPSTPSVDLLPSGIDLHSGHVFHTIITGGTNGLTLTIKDQSTGAVFSRFFPVDIPGTLLGPTGYVGFTAATGAATAVQRILNWTFTSTSTTPATTCPPNSPCFPSGFASASGLIFNGSGNSIAGPVLDLANSTFQKSSTYFAQTLPSNNFTTDFDFQFTTGNADGFTFVAQSEGSQALGSAGGGLGYGADMPGRDTPIITNSVAVKYDLHNNAGEGNDSTAAYINGTSPTASAYDLTSTHINLHSGHTFHARVSYGNTVTNSTGLANVFTCTLTDLTTYASFVFVDTINDPQNSALNPAATYFGFTAGTGTLPDTIRILNWTLTSN